MNRIIPSVRQLCYAVIGSIASHPLIQNPPIYYPVVKPGQNPQQILIKNYRTYGGMEILNVGDLCCAVYPSYVPRHPKSGHPSTERDNQKSISYAPYELGKATEGALEKVKVNLIVELHYGDVALNRNPTTVDYISAVPLLGDYLNGIPERRFGVFHTQKEANFGQPISADGQLRKEFETLTGLDQPKRLVSGQVSVDINPGEEILRDYMELLRIVLNQSDLLPFNVTSKFVKNIDFPTTSWLESSPNVFFHFAYLVWELEMYFPVTNYLFSSPEPVSNLNINLNN
jgi:hypothetical protein